MSGYQDSDAVVIISPDCEVSIQFLFAFVPPPEQGGQGELLSYNYLRWITLKWGIKGSRCLYMEDFNHMADIWCVFIFPQEIHGVAEWKKCCFISYSVLLNFEGTLENMDGGYLFFHDFHLLINCRIYEFIFISYHRMSYFHDYQLVSYFRLDTSLLVGHQWVPVGLETNA